MNRLLDFIGRYIQVIGLLILGGFLLTAAAMYYGIPSFAQSRHSPSAASHEVGGCIGHAVGYATSSSISGGCEHSMAPASSGCCSAGAASPRLAHDEATTVPAPAPQLVDQPRKESHAH